MKSPPIFVRGAYRAHEVSDVGAQGRAWKFFLPSLATYVVAPTSSRGPRPQEPVAGEVLIDSQSCATQAATASHRRRRRDKGDDSQAKADRAEALVQLGELSAARHVLEGSPLAPGTQATLDALQIPEKRPPEPLPDYMWNAEVLRSASIKTFSPRICGVHVEVLQVVLQA